MQIEFIPALIEQYSETFEGEVQPDRCWITDGQRKSGVWSLIEGLMADQAFAPPAPGARSIAAHVRHLRLTLDRTLERFQGDTLPPWDGVASFRVLDSTPGGWGSLKCELRQSYLAVLAFLQEHRGKTIQEWPPGNLAKLAAMIAHNAYHLGAIRQMATLVRGQQARRR